VVAMLSGRGRRAGAERRRTAPPAPALLADMALPGRLAVLFSRDMPEPGDQGQLVGQSNTQSKRYRYCLTVCYLVLTEIGLKNKQAC